MSPWTHWLKFAANLLGEHIELLGKWTLNTEPIRKIKFREKDHFDFVIKFNGNICLLFDSFDLNDEFLNKYWHADLFS